MPFLEVQNWQQYTQTLTQWAGAMDAFETTVHRISELPGLVVTSRSKSGTSVVKTSQS